MEVQILPLPTCKTGDICAPTSLIECQKSLEQRCCVLSRGCNCQAAPFPTFGSYEGATDLHCGEKRSNAKSFFSLARAETGYGDF